MVGHGDRRSNNMPISLEAIVMEILTTTAVETIDQLVSLVAAHSEYRGRSKGKNLKNRIIRILQDERFQQEMQGNNISLGFKLGRIEFKGKIDLS